MSETKKIGILSNLFGRKKLILGLLLAIITGPLGWVPMRNGTTILINSHLGNLIMLAVIITAIVKIAMRDSKGWLWGAAFFFYSAFGQQGIPAWFYMALAAGGVITYIKWTTPK